MTEKCLGGLFWLTLTLVLLILCDQDIHLGRTH